MLTRGPYAHDTDGPMDRGPYSHAIPTLALTKSLLVVTATFAGLAPGYINWGDTVSAPFTDNNGALQHTYGAAGVKTVTLTDAVGNTTTQQITLT